MWLYSLLIFAKLYHSLAFNVDLDEFIVFTPESEQGLFGASVALAKTLANK